MTEDDDTALPRISMADFARSGGTHSRIVHLPSGQEGRVLTAPTGWTLFRPLEDRLIINGPLVENDALIHRFSWRIMYWNCQSKLSPF